MNLSPMLDVAIAVGLVYFILSILAAELLGLLTTLLQWRSEHLKKSVSILLTGQSPAPPQSRFIVDRLYAHPILRSLIHNETRSVAASVRKVGRSLRSVGCAITQSEDVLEGNPLPDEIPVDFLAIALIDGLQLPHLSHTYSAMVLQTFVHERLAQIHLLLKDLRNSLGLGNSYPNANNL